MTQTFEFPGTDREKQDLLDAMTHNCNCGSATYGVPPTRCGAHDMLLDEVVVHRLVFERRDHMRLEHMEATDGRVPA